MKSNVGKDPMRLQTKELETALQKLDEQKSRARLEREKFMLEADQLKPGDGEKPKR